MTNLKNAASVVHHGAVIAIADFASVYSWKTWLGGWLIRMVSQVAFYSLIAGMVGDANYVVFVVLGAAMMVCVAESFMAVASTTWDQHLGTLPLLVSAPVQPGWFYLGRSVMWPVSATATSSVSILIMSIFFNISWTVPQVIGAFFVLLATSFANYTVALFVGCLALVAPGARNVMSAVATMSITTFCGAMVPVTYWPQAVQWVANTIPVTHGLTAMRHLHAGAAASDVWLALFLTVGCGIGWCVVAFVAFNSLFNRSKNGSSILL